jgi:hypothetical protein
MVKRKCTKEKQRSKKHIYKAKGRVARVSLKSWVNSGAPDPDPDGTRRVNVDIGGNSDRYSINVNYAMVAFWK